MEEEIWCPINGYEGLYEVSDQGRVKSVGYGDDRILKPRRNGRGYLRVNLYKNGEQKTCYVHRIVAQTFIPNPDNLPEVNHIDEVKTHNSVQNLEWCSEKYNSNFGSRNQRIADKKSKSVLQYTKSGEFVREWKSMNDVKRSLKYSQGNISSCCAGKRKSAYNYIWKYKD